VVSRTVKVFYAAFIALILAASLSGEKSLWGAGSWGSVSPTAATVLAAVLLLLLSAKVRRGLEKALELPDNWAWKGALTISALIFAALWLLRSRHFLWSDSYSMGMAVDSGIPFVRSAPLASAVSMIFFNVLNRLLFWNPFETAALLSLLAAMAFLPAVRASVRSFPAAAAAAAGGYFAVFFGLGGASPLAAAGAGIFIWLSAVRLRGGKVPLVIPLAAAAAAVMLQFSNIFLAVPALYLLVRELRRRESRLEAAAAAGTAVLCWIAGDLAVTRLAGLPGMTSGLIASASRIIPALSGAGAAGSLSAALNALVLCGPAALLAIITAVSTRPGRGGSDLMPFLRITAAAAAIFIFLAAPWIRGGLRWEIAAPAAAAMSIYAAAALRDRASSAREFTSSAALIISLGIFHLIPVVLAGASLEIGERRLLSLPLSPGKAETVIGAQAWRDRDYDKAAEWWMKASKQDEGNADVWYRLGTAMMKLEEPLDAITDFHRAAEIDPENSVYRTWLAEAYIENRWYEEAVSELEVLTSEFPDSARLWTRLGYARNHGNMYTGAIEAYRNALELDPGNMQYVRNLTSALLNRGAELQEEGDYAGARSMYWRARDLYPQDWVSLNNLATVEMELGEWKKAKSFLETALKAHVGIAQLHFNMSVVLENLGEYTEAVRQLREAARLDPINPPSAEHIERLMKKAEGDSSGR
jgi:tetratricopeptide (TPR) repeat protein